MTTHFVIMGVCGCGKTTAALALQRHLQCPYAEGDDFHSRENRSKMAAGTALTDEDRLPWLRSLRDWMARQAQAGETYSIVSCSALKRAYRDILREAPGQTVFLHLSPPKAANLERIRARQGHYMKAGMLDTQLAVLEELGADEAGVKIENAGSPEAVQAEITDWIKAQGLWPPA